MAEGLLTLTTNNLVTSGGQAATEPPYNTLTYQFSGSQTFRGQELALNSVSLYYSWKNITAAYGNNTFSYKWVDGITYPVTLPDGLYVISDINNYLVYLMTANLHYLINAASQQVFYAALITSSVEYGVNWISEIIPTTLPAGWTAPVGNTWWTDYSDGGAGTPEGPQLVLDASSFNDIIGFAANTNYPSSGLPTANYAALSTFAPEVSPVSTVLVNCNRTSFGLSLSPNAIFAFSPTVEFGEIIYIDVAKLVYLPISDGQQSSLTITFTDQNGLPLIIIDPAITLTLAIRNAARRQ